MLKLVKISTKLPTALMTTLRQRSMELHIEPSEYIRRVVTEALTLKSDNTAAVQVQGKTTKLPERAANTRSGYRGVYPYGKDRWAAVLTVDGRQKRLGVYATPEEAASAYDEARKVMNPNASTNADFVRTQEYSDFVETLKQGRSPKYPFQKDNAVQVVHTARAPLKRTGPLIERPPEDEIEIDSENDEIDGE